eukprot:scaffold56615_cov53-Attheya_sp.AAC.3
MRLVLAVGTLVDSLQSEMYFQSYPLFSAPSVSHQLSRYVLRSGSSQVIRAFLPQSMSMDQQWLRTD